MAQVLARKKSAKLRVRKLPGGVGVFYAKGLATRFEKSVPSFETQGKQTLSPDLPGNVTGCPGLLAVFRTFAQKILSAHSSAPNNSNSNTGLTTFKSMLGESFLSQIHTSLGNLQKGVGRQRFP